MITPPKPQPGDRVAILSPAAGLPAVFPLPYELGLRRLRERFGLEPVEYPTTRVLDAAPEDRARDMLAAFADPDIRAVITSIGGEDQLKVLRHLDPAVIAADPKPFFGFSDNTNLLTYLWNLGIVSYHGGAVMTAFGRRGAMHPLTEASLRAALFTTDEHELVPSPAFTDIDHPWDDEGGLASEPALRAADGWRWHGPPNRVVGRAWGGNLEILDFLLRSGRHIQANDAYTGCILYLETSEELPSPTYVYRVLMGIGERGLLEQFAALLFGRPKAWSFEQPNDDDARARYTEEVYAAVLRAMGEYSPDVPIVLGLDIGHTDPQLVVPNGGVATVDGSARRVVVRY